MLGEKIVREDTFVFELNSQNTLLNHIYKQGNIRVIDGMADNKKCIIICSSNSIYFPNTYEEFRLKIICNNLFDGERLSSLLIEYVERIILIRDVRKSFYVTGISEKCNSIDNVLHMLEELTKGFEIITAGGSAGGYMASIIGSYLKVQYVINAGGQWNLYEYNDVIERYSFLSENKYNVACNKWFDLSVRMAKNQVPILYMYGALNKSDINQLKCAESIEHIYPIAIKSQNHAQSVSTEPYLRLLCATREDILKIYNDNKECMVDIDILESQINALIALPEGMKLSWATTNEKKQKAYEDMLYEWVKMKQNAYPREHYDCSMVAIWGKGRYCSLLMSDLRKQNIKVRCILETQPLDKEYEGIPIMKINDLPDGVDTIIVVPYYDIENIKERVDEYCVGVNVIGIDEYIMTNY